MWCNLQILKLLPRLSHGQFSLNEGLTFTRKNTFGCIQNETYNLWSSQFVEVSLSCLTLPVLTLQKWLLFSEQCSVLDRYYTINNYSVPDYFIWLKHFFMYELFLGENNGACQDSDLGVASCVSWSHQVMQEWILGLSPPHNCDQQLMSSFCSRCCWKASTTIEEG